MERFGVALAIAMLGAGVSAQAADDSGCKLCLEARAQQPKVPLDVQVESGLTFSRLALTGSGNGNATIDAQTGTKSTAGDLIDLGGLSYQGHATVTGEPYSSIRVELPGSVTLYAANGARVELSDFRTNLPSLPVLDGNGRLEFSFGARLETNGAQGGNFRGRIPIRFEYS